MSATRNASKNKHSVSPDTVPGQRRVAKRAKRQGNVAVMVDANTEIETLKRQMVELKEMVEGNVVDEQKLAKHISESVLDMVVDRFASILDKKFDTERKMTNDKFERIDAMLPPSTTLAFRDGSSPSPLTVDTTCRASIATKALPKQSRESLRTYLRFEWYGNVKFMTDEQAQQVLEKGQKDQRIDKHVTTYKQVQAELAGLRQNSRSGAKKEFIAARKGENGKKVPEGFPEAILPEILLDGSVRMKDSYRNYEGDSYDKEAEEQFVWFLENVVQKMNPKKNDFGSRCPHHTISDIFHHTDEAWALMVLLNEHEAWEWEALRDLSEDKPLYIQRNPKPNHKFTSRANTNSKKKWGDHELKLLKDIGKLVKQKRETDVSKEWEERYKTEKHRTKIRSASAGRCLGMSVDAGEEGLDNNESCSSTVDSDLVIARNESEKLAMDDFLACLNRPAKNVVGV